MTRQGRLSGTAALLAAGLILAGCSSTGGNALMYRTDLNNLRRAVTPGGNTFPAALASEYLALGDSEAAQADWVDSDHFARKGLTAARGQAPAPDEVSSRDIPAVKQSELSAARQRLVTVLGAGAGDRAPALAARAQSRYDCWLEQQEENWQVEDIATCRSQFLAAMDELEARPAAQPPAAAQPAPAAPTTEFRVYFDFDRSNLTAEGRQIVQQAASEAKRGGTARLELVGKADRSGTDQYNLRLSERRAKAVVEALVAAGVPRGNIESRAVGESQPPVPTPDGVREPRNRVVEIGIR
jgi:OmpA-OmpF porin, OOP family